MITKVLGMVFLALHGPPASVTLLVADWQLALLPQALCSTSSPSHCLKVPSFTSPPG